MSDREHGTWGTSELEELIDAGHPAAARTRIQARLAAAPDDPQLLYLLARCELALGGHERAALAAEAAAAGMPSSPLPWGTRALALARLDRHVDARGSAEEAVRRAPDDAWCHLVLARVTLDHHPGVAYEAARKAVELDPEDAGAHFHVGLAADEKGLGWTAVQAYRKVLELQPGHPGAQLKLGIGDLEHGDWLKALRRFTDAAAVAPESEVLRYGVDVPITRGVFGCLAAVGLLSLLSIGSRDWYIIGSVGLLALVVLVRVRLPRRVRHVVWSYPRRHPVVTRVALGALLLYVGSGVASFLSTVVAQLLSGAAAALAAGTFLVLWAAARLRSGGSSS